jgi:hypothetical protein
LTILGGRQNCSWLKFLGRREATMKLFAKRLDRRTVLAASGGLVGAVAAMEVVGWASPANADPATGAVVTAIYPLAPDVTTDNAVFGELLSHDSSSLFLNRQVNGPITVEVTAHAVTWRDAPAAVSSLVEGDMILAVGDKASWVGDTVFRARAVIAPPQMQTATVLGRRGDLLDTDQGVWATDRIEGSLQRDRVTFLDNARVDPVEASALKAGDRVLASGRYDGSRVFAPRLVGVIRDR